MKRLVSDAPGQPSQEPPLFGAGASGGEKGGYSPAVWGSAALIVLVIVGALAIAGRRKTSAPTTLQSPDAYAASLPITGMAMSESASYSGAKVTYLDGHIQNAGSRTLIGATAQVVFGNDMQMPPAIETVPLMLVRTTQPYIDTETVGADPLKPGDSRDFRLTFESIPDSWNQQMPELRIIRTELR